MFVLVVVLYCFLSVSLFHIFGIVFSCFCIVFFMFLALKALDVDAILKHVADNGGSIDPPPITEAFPDILPEILFHPKVIHLGFGLRVWVWVWFGLEVGLGL